jgi:hypothetical protein
LGQTPTIHNLADGQHQFAARLHIGGVLRRVFKRIPNASELLCFQDFVPDSS